MTMCDFDPLSSDEPLDLNSIRASDALISALARGDDDTVRALTVSDDALLEILRALAATGRPGARRRHVRRTEVDAHLDAAPAHHRRHPMNALATTVVVLALLAVAAAAVRALLDADYRRVRETDELVERHRAGELTDADLGDDIVAMVKAWRDEVGS